MSALKRAHRLSGEARHSSYYRGLHWVEKGGGSVGAEAGPSLILEQIGSCGVKWEEFEYLLLQMFIEFILHAKAPLLRPEGPIGVWQVERG